jgi:hypothetical protein
LLTPVSFFHILNNLTDLPISLLLVLPTHLNIILLNRSFFKDLLDIDLSLFFIITFLLIFLNRGRHLCLTSVQVKITHIGVSLGLRAFLRAQFLL